MSMPRITWGELPAAARTAVTARTGRILAATNAADGLNSGIAARLDTSNGSVFVKGIPIDHPQIRTQQREADINPYLPDTCPRLLWRITTAGWDLLGFEHLNGRTADFMPGSPDLPRVVSALVGLSRTPCPGIPLKRVDQRWAPYVEPSALPLLDGNNLLHTDMAPHNILIDSDDTAHLIDWAWPTRGPAWVDAAVWAIRLIDSGHTPIQAEEWAAQLPAWHTAPAAAVTAFAYANASLWEELAANDKANPWKGRMAASAGRWAQHRRASSPPASSGGTVSAGSGIAGGPALDVVKDAPAQAEGQDRF
jgi:hypothetical protein